MKIDGSRRGGDVAQEAAQRARRAATPGVEGLARLGYAAKGVVYATVGVLAAQVALGAGGQTTNSQGALLRIAQAPFGRVLLGVIGLGLCGYALWRLVQAALDPEGKGKDVKGILTRAGYALSALTYIGLALSAWGIVFGSGSRSGTGRGEATPEDWTARLLAQPLGQWLVGLLGLGVIAFGLYNLYAAFSAKFRDKLETSRMSRAEDAWITRAGRLGYGARGVVFGIIGVLFVRAALQSDPQQAGGLAQALSTLAAQPFGRWLLGTVSIGLLGYGLYALAESRYRRISL